MTRAHTTTIHASDTPSPLRTVISNHSLHAAGNPRLRAPTSHEMPRPRVLSKMTLPPFQDLLDAHGRDVFRFLVATVGTVEAEDCYQETWISALRAYPQLGDRSNLRGWIFTVAHRK